MEVVTETSFISCCRKTHNFSQSLPLVDHDPIRPKYPVLVGYRWVAETKQDWSKWSQSSELKFSLQLTRRRIKSHGKNFGDLKLRLWSGCTLVPLPSSASRSPSLSVSLSLSLLYALAHTLSLPHPGSQSNCGDESKKKSAHHRSANCHLRAGRDDKLSRFLASWKSFFHLQNDPFFGAFR